MVALDYDRKQFEHYAYQNYCHVMWKQKQMPVPLSEFVRVDGNGQYVFDGVGCMWFGWMLAINVYWNERVETECNSIKP